MKVRIEIVAEVPGPGPAAAAAFFEALQQAAVDVMREVGATPVSMKMREVRANGNCQ